MFCPQCGKENTISSQFCTSCGAAQPEPAMAAADGDSLHYKVMIGPKKQHYYLEKFSRFDDEGRAGISWHWPAFFFTMFWLLYRKMWGYAAIYFVLPYLITIPVTLLSTVLGKTAGNIVYAVWFAIALFVPPLLANALYYRFCKKQITKARGSSQDVQRQLIELAARGGTSGAMLVIVGLFVGIAVLGILAAIALPAYHQYTVRANLVTGADFGQRAAEAIGVYHARYQQFPENLREAGFDESVPDSVSAFRINADTGLVEMDVVKGESEIGTLLFVPSPGEGDQIVWRCEGRDIEDKLLPRSCRSQ